RRKAEADDEQTQTLEILKHALEIWPANEPAIASTELIHRLCLKEDAPTFKPSDGGRPEVELSPRRFARMVRLFGIRPINLRWEGRVRKGYQRGPLEAALAPYLSNLSATAATQLVDEQLGPDFPSATTGSVADALLSETPTKESPVADVADKSEKSKGSNCGDPAGGQASNSASLRGPSNSRYQPELLPGGGWRCECGAEGNDVLEWSKHTGASGCPLKATPSSKPSKHNFGKAQRAERREGC